MTRPDETSEPAQSLSPETPGDAPAAPPPGADARRLHATTLFLNLIVSLPAFAFLLYPLWRNPDASGVFNLVISILYGAIALPLLAVRYFRFSYWLTPDELVIVSGVFNRQQRSIPVERVQNVQIEQGVLPRLLGTAKVRVETAGSSGAEGVLEYVGLAEAQRIRQAIRVFQRDAAAQQARATELDEPAGPEASAPQIATPTPLLDEADARDAPADRTLWAMPVREVLLSGAFRFSLLFIAFFFSLLQFVGPDTDAIIDWFQRGRFRPFAEAVEASPWLALAAFVLTAILLSWLTGIVTAFNRYYGFTLTEAESKLNVRYGLLTRQEGTIPLRRVQAILLRANMLMARFGWARLEAQTMGANPDQQGHRVAVPFAQRDALWSEVVPAIRPAEPPKMWQPVSRLTIRRAFIRGSVMLTLIVAPLAYWASPWFALGALLLGPLWLYARARHRGLGYAFDGHFLFVRRGVFQRTVWVLPLDKFQVFYRHATLFQRRLGLATVLVDTAGAAALRTPYVIDLPEDEAATLTERLYAAFAVPARKPDGDGHLDPPEPGDPLGPTSPPADARDATLTPLPPEP